MESRTVPVSFLATWQVDVPFNQEGMMVGGRGFAGWGIQASILEISVEKTIGHENVMYGVG